MKYNGLLPFVNCPIHVAHNVFHKGISSSFIEKWMDLCLTFMNGLNISPAKRKILEIYQVSRQLIMNLGFWETRMLNNLPPSSSVKVNKWKIGRCKSQFSDIPSREERMQENIKKQYLSLYCQDVDKWNWKTCGNFDSGCTNL